MLPTLPSGGESYILYIKIILDTVHAGTQNRPCRFQLSAKQEHHKARSPLKNKNTQPQVSFPGSYEKECSVR